MSYTCHVNIGLEKQIFCFMLLIVAVLGYVQHSWFSDVKDGSFGVMNIIRTVRDLPPLTSTITVESSYPDQTSPSPSQHNTTSTSCQTIKRSNRKLPLVALAAAGGAGSTWAKHLLQQATGKLKLQNTLNFSTSIFIIFPNPTFICVIHYLFFVSKIN